MWVREMINLHLMCKLITSIDLKGQCGPLDLRFLVRYFGNRKGQREKSLFIYSLELKRKRGEERTKEEKGEIANEGLDQ